MKTQFNECREHEGQCHCVLLEGHPGPHECVPDPMCGGKWWRHPDEPEVLRIYRWPSNRPGCEAYDLIPDRVPDPPEGEYVTESPVTPILRAPRGVISYPAPPSLGLGT